MNIYLCRIEYTYQKYRRAANLVVLNNKTQKAWSEEVCIGNTIEQINDSRYNKYLMERIGMHNSSKLGSKIAITKVTEIAKLGLTNNRFQDEDIEEGITKV